MPSIILLVLFIISSSFNEADNVISSSSETESSRTFVDLTSDSVSSSTSNFDLILDLMLPACSAAFSSVCCAARLVSVSAMPLTNDSTRVSRISLPVFSASSFLT